MKKRKIKPTDRQKRFVEEKLKGKSNRRAALDAGYSEETADNATDRVAEKVGTIEYMRYCMRKAGITEDRAAKVLEEGMNAVTFTKDGTEVTDSKVRLDYVKYINELGGLKPSEKHEISGSININLIDSFK
jgi:phage terminase small subunit